MRSHVDFFKLLLMQFVIASLYLGHVHANDGKRVFVNEDTERISVNKNSKYQHAVQHHVHHQDQASPNMQQPHNQDQHRQQQHEQQQQRPTSSSTQSTNGHRSGGIDPILLFRNPSVAANDPSFLTFIPANMHVANPSGHSSNGNNYQYDNVKFGQTYIQADNSMTGTNIDSVPSFAGSLIGRPCTSNWQSCRQQCVRIDPNSGCPICTCERQTSGYNSLSSTSTNPTYPRPVNELFYNPSSVANYRTEQNSNFPDHPKDDENRTCEDYLHDCLPDCINFDSRGCLVCRCDVVTCRPFSRDCPREFSTIDHSGCPVCVLH